MIAGMQMKTESAQLVQKPEKSDSLGFKDLHACFQIISSCKTADHSVSVYQNPHQKMIPNNDKSTGVF